MLERTCRLIVAACVALAVIAAGLVFTNPASAATPTASVPSSSSSTSDMAAVVADTGTTSTVHTVWISVDSVTTTTSDDTLEVPTTRAAALAFVDQLNTYWHRESGGAVSVTLGGFEKRSVKTSCSVGSLFTAARAADFGGIFARSSDWSGTNKHLLAFSAESCSSDAAGQGTVGGDGGIMALGVGSSTALGLPVAAHEFGHNLGLLHANASVCPAGVDSGASCATESYGDFLDDMGYAVSGSMPHISSPQLIQLGYLTDYATLSRTTGVVDQVLAPLGATSGTRALRITDPYTHEEYVVEYRTADASDAHSLEFSTALRCTYWTSGLTRCAGGMNTAVGGIRVLRSTDDGTFVMAVGDRGTTHLDAGESFTNHDKSFRVTVTSLDPTAGAVVSVAFGDSITPIAATNVPSTSTEQPTAVTELPAPTVESYTPIEVPVETNSTTTTTAAVPATTRVTVRLRHTKIAKGKHPVAVVRVTGAAHPTGRVTVTVGGKKVRTVTLRRSDDGVRAITLPKRVKAGTFTIRVTFGGSATAAPAASAIKRLIVIK